MFTIGITSDGEKCSIELKQEAPTPPAKPPAKPKAAKKAKPRIWKNRISDAGTNGQAE